MRTLRKMSRRVLLKLNFLFKAAALARRIELMNRKAAQNWACAQTQECAACSQPSEIF